MSVKIYVEGGGDVRALKRECRHGFAEFFRRAGLEGRRSSRADHDTMLLLVSKRRSVTPTGTR